MALEVVLRETARGDLKSIFEWLEREAGPDTARTYVERIRDRCSSLGDFPNRGRPRTDLAPGLRTTLFERTALIAYVVTEREVQIVRILHRGRDPGSAFRD